MEVDSENKQTEQWKFHQDIDRPDHHPSLGSHFCATILLSSEHSSSLLSLPTNTCTHEREREPSTASSYRRNVDPLYREHGENTSTDCPTCPVRSTVPDQAQPRLTEEKPVVNASSTLQADSTATSDLTLSKIYTQLHAEPQPSCLDCVRIPSLTMAGPFPHHPSQQSQCHSSTPPSKSSFTPAAPTPPARHGPARSTPPPHHPPCSP